jgi:hypothetical protein
MVKTPRSWCLRGSAESEEGSFDSLKAPQVDEILVPSPGSATPDV